MSLNNVKVTSGFYRKLIVRQLSNYHNADCVSKSESSRLQVSHYSIHITGSYHIVKSLQKDNNKNDIVPLPTTQSTTEILQYKPQHKVERSI